MAFHVTSGGRTYKNKPHPTAQPTVRKQSFSLYPKQYDFVQDSHANIAYIAGRGAGKTFAGIVKDFLYAMEHPGARVLVCAPSYTLLRDNARQTFLDICPRDYIVRYSMKENSVALRNGSIIWFRSLDQPDLLRGYTVAAVHIDEAGSVSKEASDIVRACLRQPGYPLQRWLTTTPKGKNWIWAEFERDKDEDHNLYRARSSDNPHLPKNFEQSMGYTGLFYKQEILGLFESFEGLVYPTFSRDLIIGVQSRNDFGRTVAGVDFGYTDPACIEVVGQSKDRTCLTVCDEYYVKNVTIDDHIKAAKDLKERWDIKMFVCDPSRPDSIEMFRRAGLPVTKGHNDILGGITKVASYLPADPEKPEESRLTVSIACKNLVAEFEQYGFATNPDGEVIKEKPLDQSNHACDALRYATVYLAQSSRRDIYF
jgi:PBSX family phage terminase large subunit